MLELSSLIINVLSSNSQGLWCSGHRPTLPTNAVLTHTSSCSRECSQHDDDSFGNEPIAGTMAWNGMGSPQFRVLDSHLYFKGPFEEVGRKTHSLPA